MIIPLRPLISHACGLCVIDSCLVLTQTFLSTAEKKQTADGKTHNLGKKKDKKITPVIIIIIIIIKVKLCCMVVKRSLSTSVLGGELFVNLWEKVNKVTFPYLSICISISQSIYVCCYQHFYVFSLVCLSVKPPILLLLSPRFL